MADRLLCRDCLSLHEAGAVPRCPACGSARVVIHPELETLSIAHVDCDAFYASVEKREDPSLADKPLIVGGGRRGVVTTCCYIARILGVRSAMPMFEALKRCPDAVVLKPRMDLYAGVSREIREEMEALTPLVEPLSLDEAFLDLSGTTRLMGAPPALTLARFAAQIEARLGLTVSIGLSHNKSMAKLASEEDKPRGFAVFGRAETEAILAPRSVRQIWGVGARLAETLERDGLRTHGDIAKRDPAELVARYGSMGLRLAALSRGEDTRRVVPGGVVKSISAETTFDQDTSDLDVLAGHLWRLTVRASDRAKAKSLGGSGITLKLKTAGFRTISRQTTLNVPTSSAELMYEAGSGLLERLSDLGPFRLIGIGFSRLTPLEAGVALDGGGAGLDLDGRASRLKAEAASDSIRRRFGGDAIIRGRSLR
ncbi:MAG: DNA polymerase IV [Pseudomonadota bacterium]